MRETAQAELTECGRSYIRMFRNPLRRKRVGETAQAELLSAVGHTSGCVVVLFTQRGLTGKVAASVWNLGTQGV